MPDELRARCIEQAEAVVRRVRKELPDVWLGGRQRYVLVEAIADALQAERAAVWEAVVAETDKYDIHPTFIEWCREQRARALTSSPGTP